MRLPRRDGMPTKGERRMAFAIMRAKKLKGMGGVASSLAHCFRERETPNADPDRTADNQHVSVAGEPIDSTDKAMGRLRERLPEKRRKDAVLAVEYMMTASPEWWENASSEQQQEFFRESMSWLVEKYGEQNIVAATVHNDEKTPHLSAFVVPRTDDGRLSAKEFIGNRTQMSKDQTRYAERVEHLGVERGIKRSKATHTRIQTHYAAIEKPTERLTITPEAVEPRTLKKGVFSKEVESSEQVAARITQQVQEAYSGTAEKASEAAQERQRRQELQKTLGEQQKRLETLQRPFKGLTRDQMREIVDKAEGMRQERQQAREQARQAGRGADQGRSR